MKSVETTVANFSGAYPDTLAINASGAGATDGTEYTAEYINNFVFGIAQAFMSYADLTPDGVTESASASQMVEAMQKGFTIGPGVRQMVDFNDTPAALGYRALPQNGQGVLIATYPDLDAITYVGNGNNVTVASGGGAYYRADDAVGTNPNDAGTYLILPESRGYTPRGLDTAASIDPDGASRFLGDNQGFNTENLYAQIIPVSPTKIYSGVANPTPSWNSVRSGLTNSVVGDVIASTQGTPVASLQTAGSETRATNISTNFVVGY